MLPGNIFRALKSRIYVSRTDGQDDGVPSAGDDGLPPAGDDGAPPVGDGIPVKIWILFYIIGIYILILLFFL